MIFKLVACALLGSVVYGFTLDRVGDRLGDESILTVIVPIVAAVAAEVGLWLLLGGR